MNLLLQVGLAPDAAGDAEAWITYLNREWPPDAQQKDEEAVRRR
ncbi:hypothetical protein PF010_g31973 [Phytophthora fragariae]|uniref:Uncharacterized protein n=1 Tax=Phytophthora fragariae TaxID=53985 RepID=A0A6A4ATR2_9STRA|nr:hypothetical protein PF003_g36184 [Phytophthora fragariae]KAE8917345.1 hypothetical protein PF009_g32333 [Phytophthora fragariae]KAE8955531.1 hypothetical protein PF011_g31766 [Phytophthora fragariae]KAE9055895.1 hypothetical protein PF010_g31973 [Phytophthora fragariae]KAE9159000.1 hypothetical protein PF004_g31694 [Phytophthora fragariae]